MVKTVAARILKAYLRECKKGIIQSRIFCKSNLHVLSIYECTNTRFWKFIKLIWRNQNVSRKDQNCMRKEISVKLQNMFLNVNMFSLSRTDDMRLIFNYTK